LHGLGLHTRTASPLGGGLYTPDATRRTYARVSDLAETVAAAGYIAVVDGAFLKRGQRDLLRQKAVALQSPFVILSATASDDARRERIGRRQASNTDASEATVAVAEERRAIADGFAAAEQPFVIQCDTERWSPAQCAAAVAPMLAGSARAVGHV